VTAASDAVGVEVLLDPGGDDARHADAVAAHVHDLGLAFGVQHGGLHGFGVLLAELEHMADLDAAGQLDRAVAVRRRVALDHVADIGDERRLRQVAAEVHASEVEAVLVGADDEVRHGGHGAVGDDGDFANDRGSHGAEPVDLYRRATLDRSFRLKSNWTEEAGIRTKHRANLVSISESEFREAGKL